MIPFRIATVAAVLAVAAASFAAVPAASAKGGDGVKVRGACTKRSTATLAVKADDRGTEIEFEVDQNRNGVPWKVTLHRGGALLASATVATHAPSGSFTYRKVRAGAGTITAVATRTGERCSASAGA